MPPTSSRSPDASRSICRADTPTCGIKARPATRRSKGASTTFFRLGATLDYFLRNWAYLGVGYSFFDNRSNIPINDYLKQQVFARLGVTY